MKTISAAAPAVAPGVSPSLGVVLVDRQLRDRARRLDAGHARHADVEEDEVGPVLLGERDRLERRSSPRRRSRARARPRPSRARSCSRSSRSSSAISAVVIATAAADGRAAACGRARQTSQPTSRNGDATSASDAAVARMPTPMPSSRDDQPEGDRGGSDEREATSATATATRTSRRLAQPLRSASENGLAVDGDRRAVERQREPRRGEQRGDDDREQQQRRCAARDHQRVHAVRSFAHLRLVRHREGDDGSARLIVGDDHRCRSP